MSINKAMIAIAKDIAENGIGKTRKNDKQGYKFRGVDEVMNAFAPLLAKHEVYVRPKYTNRMVSERVNNNGTVLFYVTVEGLFQFVHGGGESVEVGPFYGEAMDSGDKASNKAMAVAFKYAMFQTFCVPLEGVTGGDADQTTHEVKPKKGALEGVWESMGEEEQAFLSQIASRVIEIIDSGDVAAAADHLKSQNLTTDEKAAIWTRFNSKQRSALKASV